MTRLALASLPAVVVAAWAVPAAAHIEMTYPPMRYTQEFIKDAPCGMIGNPPGTNEPTVLQAGEMITITIDEFVDHGGHFRISFSEDGTDQFVSPTAFDDFYPDPSVLLDDIPDDQVGGVHEIDFVVPDVNCNPCTLQALQVMSGGSFSEGSLYYNCADIVIENASGGTTSGTTGGVSVTDASASVSVTDASATQGDDTGSGGGEADGSTTASVDDNGDETPADAGDGSSGNSGTLGEATTDTNEDDDKGGCSCSTGAGPNAVWALPLFVIALARRRR